jgi:hypothetical protein
MKIEEACRPEWGTDDASQMTGDGPTAERGPLQDIESTDRGAEIV